MNRFCTYLYFFLIHYTYHDAILKKLKYFLIILITAGCKEKFDLPVIAMGTNYLVVEGFINSGEGATNIHLSRTTKLADTTVLKPEPGAQVMVEGDDNMRNLLSEKGAGLYSVDQLSLNNNNKYRLVIHTSEGKEYASGYVPVKQVPPIDSVSWKKENNQIIISVSAHDPQNNTRYYRWEYEETWEYHSVFESHLKYENRRIIRRDSSDNIFKCWHIINSPTIQLGSSVRLVEDVIADYPIMIFPIGSEKTRFLYSILVKQYAIDKGSYEFWSLMKKNTEQIGSVFDAQPSQLTGNIVCVNNPKEQVIGYISASSVTTKRIFINYTELLPEHFYSTPFSECRQWNVEPDSGSLNYYFGTYSALFTPLDSNYAIPVGFIGIGRAEIDCADCREKGGTNKKPSYWP